MAEQFNQHGYDFYALDLRKYGRSKLPHQTLYYVRDLREYDAEISKALEIIGQENHNQVLLAGHSTGGLITTLYAAHYPDHRLVIAGAERYRLYAGAVMETGRRGGGDQ